MLLFQHYSFTEQIRRTAAENFQRQTAALSWHTFTFCIHSRQPTQHKLCAPFGGWTLEMSPRVEKIHLREKVGENVEGSHVFCISGVCDHKVSLIRHSRRMLKRASFDPSSAMVLPQYQDRNTAAEKAANKPWCSPYFSYKQTADICRLAHQTLHLELFSKSPFDFHR